MSQEQLLDRPVPGKLGSHTFGSPDRAKTVAPSITEKTPAQDPFNQYLNVPDQMNHFDANLNWVDHDNLPKFSTRDDSALIISNKIKEKGKFILPLKQKKVSEKMKLLKESGSEVSESILKNDSYTPQPLPKLNLGPNKSIPDSQNVILPQHGFVHRSDSEVDRESHKSDHISSPRSEAELKHSQSLAGVNEPLVGKDPVVEPTSDIEDGNNIDHSSSPTIPVDSPSMHVFPNSNDESEPNNHVINSSDKFQHQFMVNTSQTFQEPPTFANVEVKKLSKKPTTNNKANISFSIATNLIDAHKNTYTPSTPKDKVIIFNLLRDGIREYASLLTDFSEDRIVQNRSDFLVSFLRRFNYELKPKLINDYLGEIKKDKIDENIRLLLNNESFSEEVKQLLIESEKRRKCYNKKKSAKSSDSKKSSPVFTSSQSTPVVSQSTTFTNMTTDTSTPSSAKSNTLKLLPKVEQNKPERAKAIVINLIRIGSFINQRQAKKNGQGNENLVTVADLRNITKKRDDERYVHKLRATNSSLKRCVEDIYGENIDFTHSLAYSRVPLALNPLTSINLENDQMISYVEILLDVSRMILPGNRSINSNVNYASILQLKSITRVYNGDELVYRRCDPITGFFTKNNANVAKIILPLQAKLWANLINDYHNGIIDDQRVSTLKITHTLFPNDDIIRFKSGISAIYSFIWEFVINVDGQYLPHCISIEKDPLSPPSKTIIQSRSKSDVQFADIQHKPSQHHSTVNNKVSPNLSTIKLPSEQQQPPQFIPATTQSLRRAATTQGNSNFVTTNKLNSNPNHPVGIKNLNYLNPVHSYNKLNAAFNNTAETPIVTSTPLLTQRKRNELGRGHKRTRSRSMNEIDLMSLPLAFDGFMNMSFLDTFSPTESSSSPLTKQNVPYLKSQSTHNLPLQNNQQQQQAQLQRQQQLSGQQAFHQIPSLQLSHQPHPHQQQLQQQWQASAKASGGLNVSPTVMRESDIGSGHVYDRPQFRPVMEYKHFNNSDSQLELGNFHGSFDESAVNSLVINTEVNHTQVSPNPMAFSIESLEDSIKDGDNNNNNINFANSSTTNTTNTNQTNWSNLPAMDDVTIFTSAASMAPSSFDFDDNSKDMVELSALSEIPGLATPQPNQKIN